MEALRRSVPTQTRSFSSLSALSPTASSTALLRKSHYKPRITHFRHFSHPPFATNSNCKYLWITAGLGRLARRRNSLRKKLDQDSESEVPQISQENLNPINHAVDSRASEANFDNSGPEQGSEQMSTNRNDSESNNLEKSESFRESALWDKVEGWVEQYKKDIEFWGIGWRAIFTVYQDSDGNIQQVLVDEDEILRRSGVNPLYFRAERESDDFNEVISKISQAKFLAKEMESGKLVIPKNSSVTKFVVSGQDSGFVSRIRNISFPPDLLPKVSRVGIVLVCGFLFLWLLKKLFTLGGNGRELTRFEKEMLRRKIKSRMEKERSQKRNVEEPSEASVEKPQLEEVGEMNNEQAEQHVTRTRSLEIASVDMDVKIQNIRMMARHARKIEIEEPHASEGDDSDEQTLNELPVMEKDTIAAARDSVGGDELEIQASNEPPVSRTYATDTDGSNEQVQFTSVPENAEGSIADSRLDVDETGKTN